MSFHRKILGWFVVFAALTIVVFGLGDYVQSTFALRTVLETRAGALALQVAGDVEHRYERLEAELLAVGYAVAAGADPAEVAADRFASIEVVTGNAVTRALGDAEPATADEQCAVGDVAFDVPIPGARGKLSRIRAAMPAEAFFDGIASVGSRIGKRGFTTVVAADNGSVVFDHDCAVYGDAGGSLPAAIARHVGGAAELQPGTTRSSDLGADRSDRRILTTARAGALPWVVVVGLDYAEFEAPFVQMRRQYIGVMGAVLLLAMLLVVAGMRRDMRRLEAITSAADAIGQGNFDVWLPPPTGDEIGRVSLALGRMTERLASSLRQIEVSRAMAAVGELATFLSHEIRNPLSSIRLNLQMLGRDLRKGTVPEDGEQLVGLCLTELQRLDDVVKTVLDVGRSSPQAAGECDAHEVVHETIGVMQRKFAVRGIELDLRLEAAESHVPMSSSALRGIIMNLVLNSVDAMRDVKERRVSIATGLVEFRNGERRFELRVADTGPGVPPHLRERIFDPFFTTKPTGHGIGLAMALRSVQECHGMLRYDPASECDTGAEFVLELPIVAGAEAPAMPTPELALAEAR